MLLIQNFIALFTESAPYLLAGMLIAGLIKQWVPQRWVENTLGKKNSVFLATFIGAPLPLCSCSVIPVAMGIRRSGASKASTASFLVATPETGIDSVGITYALMGPIMAIVRPAVAVVSALITGLAIQWFGNRDTPEPSTKNTIHHCCGKGTAIEVDTLSKIKQAFVYGYGKLLSDFMLWLLIGLVFAAAISTFVPSDFLLQYGTGIVTMCVIVAVSIPMYICATASTPIAVGLMLSGLSPGAALVFMLTGPATNIATLMVIKNELGKRELVIYLTSVIACAIGFGLLVDMAFDTFGWSLALQHGDHHGMQNVFFSVSAAVLAVLMFYQAGKRIIAFWPQAKQA